MSKSFQSAAARIGQGPVEFDVDGEAFYAAAVMPAEAVLNLAALAGETDRGAQARAVAGFLDLVLLPESAERFAARLKDAERPFGVEDASAVLTWLIEDVYGLRPTVPSSPSAGG